MLQTYLAICITIFVAGAIVSAVAAVMWPLIVIGALIF